MFGAARCRCQPDGPLSGFAFQKEPAAGVVLHIVSARHICIPLSRRHPEQRRTGCCSSDSEQEQKGQGEAVRTGSGESMRCAAFTPPLAAPADPISRPTEQLSMLSNESWF